MSYQFVLSSTAGLSTAFVLPFVCHTCQHTAARSLTLLACVTCVCSMGIPVIHKCHHNPLLCCRWPPTITPLYPQLFSFYALFLLLLLPLLLPLVLLPHMSKIPPRKRVHCHLFLFTHFVHVHLIDVYPTPAWHQQRRLFYLSTAGRCVELYINAVRVRINNDTVCSTAVCGRPNQEGRPKRTKMYIHVNRKVYTSYKKKITKKKWKKGILWTLSYCRIVDAKPYIEEEMDPDWIQLLVWSVCVCETQNSWSILLSHITVDVSWKRCTWHDCHMTFINNKTGKYVGWWEGRAAPLVWSLQPRTMDKEK